MLILSMLLGCPTPDACRPSDSPSATLGYGETEVVLVEDGAEVDLVFGTQGGYHLPLAVDATGLATDDFVTGDFVGSIGETEVAWAEPWLTFRCNPQTESQQTWNILLVFDFEWLPEDLDGQVVDVVGSLRDNRGMTVDVSHSFTVNNPSP